MNHSPRQHSRRGTVIVVVVVLLLVVAAIAGSILHAVRLDVRQFPVERRALQADRLAEAGLARAVARLATDGEFQGEEWTAELPSGESGLVAIRIDSGETGRTVTAVSTFPAAADRPARSRRTLILP